MTLNELFSAIHIGWNFHIWAEGDPEVEDFSDVDFDWPEKDKPHDFFSFEDGSNDIDDNGNNVYSYAISPPMPDDWWNREIIEILASGHQVVICVEGHEEDTKMWKELEEKYLTLLSGDTIYWNEKSVKEFVIPCKKQ